MSQFNGYGHQQLAPITNLNRPYQQDSTPSQILPPLHSQGHGTQTYPPAYMRPSPHTPRSPGPSVGSTASTANLAQIAPHRSLGSSQPPSNYTPIVPNYPSHTEPPTSASAQPNSTTSVQNGLYSQMALPQISMFGDQQRNNMSNPYNHQPHLPSQSQYDNRPTEPRLLPVVGSQGRRGILPSAPGRAHPVGSVLDGTGRPGMSPVKDSDGKFPCQFCNKTYLHLKHLKRHHLRHTGERPYQCYLCNETFCRSDILKRHFVKCSARRGNPTGATHLTHAQAHLRAAPSVQSPTIAQSNDSPHTPSTGPPSSFREPWSNNANGFSNFSQGQMQPGSSYVQDSNRSSRASSIMRPDSSEGDDRNRFSSAPTLPPMNVAMDGHPNGHFPVTRPANSDQHFAPVHYSRDQFDGSGYNDPHNPNYFSTSAGQPYPASTHADNGQSHLRGDFPQYSNGLSQPSYGQTEEWKSFLQPGGTDVMFPSQ